MRCTSLTKSIFTSTTFWSIILLLCQAVGPSIDKVIARGELTYADVWAIFQACITAMVGAIARYNIGDVHTPKGVPGVDPPSRRDVQDDVRRNVQQTNEQPMSRGPSSYDAVPYNESRYSMDDISDVDISSRDRACHFRLTDGSERRRM